MTASNFNIEYCQFGPMDCKLLWTPKMTYFGRCLEFSSFDLGPQLAKLGKREIQMSVLASYNTSDWSHGWVSMMEGFSIFVNSEMEETLDDALTVLSGDRRKLVITNWQDNYFIVSDLPHGKNNPSGSLVVNWQPYCLRINQIVKLPLFD